MPTMNASRLQLKIFAAPGSRVAPEALIPVFHSWIKHHRLPELLIDVANYAHVPKGPGVVLIGHNSDYFLDDTGGRLGLLHNRKRGGTADGTQRLSDLFRRTLHAASLLEEEGALNGALRFAPNEFQLRINDRLAAPQGEATFLAMKPELEAVARQVFEGPFTLTPVGDQKSLFGVTVASAAANVELGTLLARLGGPPVADLS
jgi:hypothetical protein